MTMRVLYVLLLLVFIGGVFGRTINDRNYEELSSEYSLSEESSSEKSTESASTGNTLGPNCNEDLNNKSDCEETNGGNGGDITNMVFDDIGKMVCGMINAVEKMFKIFGSIWWNLIP